MENTNRVRSIEEAAAFLGLSRQRVGQLLAEGRISGHKLHTGPKAAWVVTATDQELQAFKDTPRPVGQPPKNREQE
jgi:excisionase family DNA binding protein